MVIYYWYYFHSEVAILLRYQSSAAEIILQSSTILEGVRSAVFLTWHWELQRATEFLSYTWIPPGGILLRELYSLHTTYMMFLNELPILAHTCTFLLNPWHTCAGINMHKWWLIISLATENIWILSLFLGLCFWQNRQQFPHRFARKIGSLMFNSKLFSVNSSGSNFHQAAPNAMYTACRN